MNKKGTVLFLFVMCMPMSSCAMNLWDLIAVWIVTSCVTSVYYHEQHGCCCNHTKGTIQDPHCKACRLQKKQRELQEQVEDLEQQIHDANNLVKKTTENDE